MNKTITTIAFLCMLLQSAAHAENAQSRQYTEGSGQVITIAESPAGMTVSEHPLHVLTATAKGNAK